MPDRSTRYLLDNTVFIAAVKRKWIESTGLIYHLLDRRQEAGTQGCRGWMNGRQAPEDQNRLAGILASW